MATITTETLVTGEDVRLFARGAAACPNTSGLAPSYLQANLIILPSRYADDFRQLCARNPVPCPLIAVSEARGRWDAVTSCVPGVDGKVMVSNLDIRRDAPKYNVYVDSKLARRDCPDIVSDWTDDHVAFLIGCSFSFETSLSAAGLPPLHTSMSRNVPMYRTSLPLCPAGVFTGGTYVVSMRPYRRDEVDTVRRITRAYSITHGEPVAWGWGALETLGIANIDEPQWGDRPITRDGKPLGMLSGSDDLVPVFWGCGVTPQEAVMRAQLQGTVMAHSPGHMLLLDSRDTDIIVS